MLTENDVIDALSVYLTNRHYAIVSTARTTQRGHDIVADHLGERLFIEAKGETSSKSATKCFGKPFTTAQIRVHVAEAFFKALATKQAEPTGIAAVAFPSTDTHHRLAKSIWSVARTLDIRVFFVREGGDVTEIV